MQKLPGRPWSSFSPPPMGNRYLSQNSLPHAAVNGHFPRSPWAVGSTGKILRFDAEIGGMGFVTAPMGPTRNGRKLQHAAEIRGCPLAGTLDRDPHHAAVLPLDLFDQPTIQSIGQLSDEPSLAALDDLSADPTPILEALEEMAATNDRFLMLLVV